MPIIPRSEILLHAFESQGEEVAEAVAEEVHAEDGEHEGEPRENRHSLTSGSRPRSPPLVYIGPHQPAPLTSSLTCPPNRSPETQRPAAPGPGACGIPARARPRVRSAHPHRCPRHPFPVLPLTAPPRAPIFAPYPYCYPPRVVGARRTEKGLYGDYALTR